MKAYIVKNKQGEYLCYLDQAVYFQKEVFPWSIEFFETEFMAEEFMRVYSSETDFDIFEVNIP